MTAHCVRSAIRESRLSTGRTSFARCISTSLPRYACSGSSTISAKGRAILGHTYGVFGYEKLSADELGLREMLSPDGVTKARKSALERLRSRYPGSGLHLWRDVYHTLKDI